MEVEVGKIEPLAWLLQVVLDELRRIGGVHEGGWRADARFGKGGWGG